MSRFFSVSSVVSGWMIGGLSPGRGWDFFLFAIAYRFPPSLLSSGYQGLFPGGKVAWGVKLTTHLHIVPRSRLRGAIPLPPEYAFTAWCSIKKITGTSLPLKSSEYHSFVSDLSVSASQSSSFFSCIFSLGYVLFRVLNWEVFKSPNKFLYT
jgi:hypothetical protein